MKILALDSSAVSASAAVLDDDKVLGEFFINTKQTHSQTLMPMVQQVLIQTKTSLEEIDLFAVSAGPGSFTGVRIGVACVKGMAFAQNKPCIGVSTLEAMAYPLSMLNGIICAVMDARCQQVYHALFRVNVFMTIVQLQSAIWRNLCGNIPMKPYTWLEMAQNYVMNRKRFSHCRYN